MQSRANPKNLRHVNLCLCYILHLSVLLALGSWARWYIRKGIGLSYYMKGARNPPPLWWLPGRSTRCIKNSFQLPRRTLTPCHISNDQDLVCVCNLDNKPKIKDPYSKFNVRSKNNAHMQLLLSFITCQCICFSIFNGVTSLKKVPFFTEKKIEKLPRGSSYTLSLRTENFNSN